MDPFTHTRNHGASAELLEDRSWLQEGMGLGPESLLHRCESLQNPLNRVANDDPLQPFPVQEYEYEFYHLDLDAKITLLPSPGSPCLEFEPPYNDVPRFKSTVHPLLVLHYSTFLRDKSMIIGGRRMPNIVGDFTFMWSRVPVSFSDTDEFQDSTDFQSNCAAPWKPRLNWGRDLQTDERVRRHITTDPGTSSLSR